MTLFCTVINRDFVSLLRFHLRSLVRVILCAISLFCHLKYPYTCFSSHFCLQDFLVLFLFVLKLIPLILLLEFATINISLLFFVNSLNLWIIVSMQSSMLSSFLPLSFLDRQNLSILLTVLCMVTNLLVFCSICLTYSSVHFKKGPEYLSKKTVQVIIFYEIFVAEFNFEKFSCFSKVLFSYFFFYLCFIVNVCFKYFQVFVAFSFFFFFFFFTVSWFSPDYVVLFLSLFLVFRFSL